MPRFNRPLPRNGEGVGSAIQQLRNVLGLPGMYPEHLRDITFAALTETRMEVEIPKDKSLWGLLLEFEGRVTTSVAAPVGVKPEAPVSLIERVRVEGSHKSLGSRTPFNLRGDTLHEYTGIMLKRRLTVNDGGLAAAIDDFDVRFWMLVPFVPLNLPPQQQLFYLLHGPSWRTLNLFLTFGNGTSLFDDLTGVTVAFTAFGAATGNPRVRVHTIRPNLADARDAIVPGIVHHTFRPLTGVLTGGNLTDGFISDLSVGKRYLMALLKTGTRAPTTALGAGVEAFSTLSDDIITRPKIKLDNKPVRDAIDARTMKEYYAMAHQFTPRVGYQVLSFIEQGDVNTAFPAEGLTRDRRWELDGDITSAANQVGEVVEVEVEGQPGMLQ